MHDSLQHIKCLLEGESTPFSCSGEVFVQPELHVSGLGQIELPVTQKRAEEITKVSEQAPYGLGTETRRNKLVRNSWQLAPEKFEVRGQGWQRHLNRLVADVSGKFGVAQPDKVEAHPYKLLVYLKGGHFDFHQDTEKFEGMFATLIVQMPSSFKGGTYVVRSNGTEHRYKLSKDSDYARRVKYVAHFADCDHAIEKVTSGCRIAIVYSLCLPENMPRPEPRGPGAEQLAEVLKEWIGRKRTRAQRDVDRDDDDEDAELDVKEQGLFACVLQQEYSENALQRGAQALKGGDLEKAALLMKANKLLGKTKALKLYIATATLQVECNPADGEDIFDEYTGRAYGKYNRNDLSIWEPSEGSELVATVNIIAAVDNDPLPLERKFNLATEGTLLHEQASDAAALKAVWGAPTKDSGVRPTGNEGAEREFWYQRCLLIAAKKGMIK